MQVAPVSGLVVVRLMEPVGMTDVQDEKIQQFLHVSKLELRSYRQAPEEATGLL